MAERVDVLGLQFDRLTRARAADAVVALASGDRPAYVVKPYSEFMPRAARDRQVREVLSGAALCLADGVGILWAAHYLSLRGGAVRALLQLPASLLAMVLSPGAVRSPLPEAMAGVDFTWQMLEQLARAQKSVYLLGGTAEEVAGAARRAAGRIPLLKITGSHHGYFRRSGAENETVVAAINATGADVLLVAMGFPRQELWLAQNLPRLGVRVAVAEGGSFSFMSGMARRAPRWMRRSGLEWLFRLVRQPARLKRQLALPAFVWLVVRERLRRGGAEQAD